MWLKIDDSFHDHPKVVEAGNAAVGLWVKCLAWSSRHLTDGHIPAAVVRQLGTQKDADTLTRVGLWQTNGDGVTVPDYLDYNPSADEVRDQRSKRAEAGRRGGIRSGEKRRQP